MRTAVWLGAALTAVALVGFANSGPAQARDGEGRGAAFGGYSGGYRGYADYRGARSYGYYGPVRSGYGVWTYGRPQWFGYMGYSHPYLNGPFGRANSWYGYGLGYSPYYFTYGFPYQMYGLHGGYGGYGYPELGYSYGYAPYTTLIEPTMPQTGIAGDYAVSGAADFKAGRYNLALREWEPAMVENPENGGLALLTGQALFAVGKFDEAAGAVERGLSVLPESRWGEVVSSYRLMYGNPSDYRDQLKALETACKQKESAALEFLLGYHYGYLGFPREAVRELDKAISLNPEDRLATRLRQIMGEKFAPNPGSVAP